MKNKAIILLISLLILSIFGTVYAAAFATVPEQATAASQNEKETSSESPEKKQTPETAIASEKIERFTTRAEAMERMESPLAENATEMLNYKETFNNSIGDYLDIYSDREDNEYLYDPFGKFVGWRYSDDKWWNYSLTLDSRYIISVEEAVASAETAAKEIFGSAFDAFVLQQAKLINNSHFWVIYETQYGENGFLGGAECRIKVLRDGTVILCQMPYVHDYDDFDSSLISGINESMLTEYTAQQIHEIYGDEIGGYEIKKMSVIKNNGRFQILIQSDIILGKDGSGGKTLARVYYDLH